MPLTAQQICTLAAQEAKCPGFTAQSGQFLNATLQDLCQNYDLDAALGSNPFTFNSAAGNGSGPYTLPLDYLRTQVKDGKDEIFYTINGVPYPLIQVTKAEYDWLVQTPGFNSYPYNYATDISQTPAQLFVWPPASGSYVVSHRYYKLMPDIATPETSATVPWFLNTQILIRSVAGRLMGLTGDSRQAEYLGDGERYPLGAGTLLNAYLKNVEDREGAVHTVGKDRRRWGRPFDQLKNTKNIGWALAGLLCTGLWWSDARATCTAPCTAAQINADTIANFPDNTTGAITPVVVRGWQTNLVGSIMPTAPVVSGNVPSFNGTTGLLQDSGSVVRTTVTNNLTMWVRSDGSDANCTGKVNAAYVSGSFPQACAKATWNNLYGVVAAQLDFAGWTVTLKSGTTNTYTSGLFMSSSWTGGGQLIIDLAGSSIAETVTKGIINDVVQPGQITIINSSGLGVGGNVSSAGFSCIQNDQPSDMNIGQAGSPGINGISTGPCFDAHYEAIQTGNIYFAAPINIKGAGGNELLLTANSSNLGINGQTINICSNQTYSLGTAVAQTNSNIQANSAVFNLNPACGGGPYTVTGPRYSVTLHGTIYTAAAGASFIPGTTPGTGDSGGCYDSTCYESLADGTAVLGTLLATNVAAPASPAAGKLLIWADSTALALQSKNSAGAVTTMVFPQAASGNLFVTGLSTSGGLLTAQPTFTNLATGTATAFTLGGTVSGGGNQINNVIIGTSTPLAGTFTTLTANTSVSSPIHTAAGSHTFQSNGSTFAGIITTGQQWFFGTTSNTPPTGPIVTVSKNTAATVALGTPSGITGTAQAVMTLVGVDGSPADINVQSFGNTATPAALRFFHAAGTALSPTATQTATTMGDNVFYGFKTAGGNAYVAGGGIIATSTDSWTNLITGMRLDFLATATGTTGFTTSASIGGGLMVGTTTDPGAGSMQLNAQQFMPNITTSSAAQTGTVCWTTGTGKLTADTTVGCLTSLLAAKNVTERLSSEKALDIVARLDPFSFRYKKGWGDGGRYEQFGLGAEEVAQVDERLVGRDPAGALQGVRYQELGAVLVGAIKELKAEVQQMRGLR